jgi:hypothetical protein
MNLKIIFPFILLLICGGLAFESCTKDKTPRPAPGPAPCDPEKVYFQNSIQPLVNSSCAKSGCHDAITKEEGLNLSTYEGVRSIVRPGRPEDSELIEMINESEDKRMPPPPSPPLTADQKELLRKWIAQGADNAVCEADTGSCNPSGVSFAGDIQPILGTNCTGCHSGATISGGVNLSTYAGVQAVAQSGKLYNAVSQNGLATPMPPNGKLPACDIQRIKVWISEGIKNN